MDYGYGKMIYFRTHIWKNTYYLIIKYVNNILYVLQINAINVSLFKMVEIPKYICIIDIVAKIILHYLQWLIIQKYIMNW